MDTPALILIIILAVLAAVLGNAYFENTNEISKLKHALRLSNAQNRADAREINDLKCELTKTKHDYACQVADCKCGKDSRAEQLKQLEELRVLLFARIKKHRGVAAEKLAELGAKSLSELSPKNYEAMKSYLLTLDTDNI